ncbi:MAG: NTP transferase domain-containing protein [Deltaproteobacteria bacterium]|nr:NTP transferase domain-containing protein [Deltaproteobacteria bacterium]
MKAVILAGGRGTRLAPLTVVFPKPLVPLGNRPILETIILQLLRHGLRDVVLSVDHLADLIRAYFAARKALSRRVAVSFVQDEAPAGTAGSLASIPGLDETFLVMNGDVLTTLDYTALIAHHRAGGAALTIATRKREVTVDLGVLRYDERGTVTDYLEKPKFAYDVSMGVYVYEPRVLGFIERGKYLDFPDLVLRLIRAGERVAVFPSDAYWLDIGRPDDYARATEEFSSHFGDLGGILDEEHV